MSLEQSDPFRSPAATHAALAPELSEARTADDVAPTPPPAVIVVVAEESPDATAGPGGPAYVPGPEPCGGVDDERGKAHDDCPKPPKPPKPEPGAKVVEADVAPAPRAPTGVVVALDSEPEPRPEPKPRRDEADDEPKSRPEPKSGPKAKGGR